MHMHTAMGIPNVPVTQAHQPYEVMRSPPSVQSQTFIALPAVSSIVQTPQSMSMVSSQSGVMMPSSAYSSAGMPHNSPVSSVPNMVSSPPALLSRKPLFADYGEY